ncbi:hypothetical protein TIFTF001_015262 [Ficus carica]|uniref:Uncharacterized protein n=1 Tax=Ficus carica TaxID=3494 RepID=A0AA88A453_FICCA|nr:hypothetical protein TIFTF001_015262 [Ficus carica]
MAAYFAQWAIGPLPTDHPCLSFSPPSPAHLGISISHLANSVAAVSELEKSRASPDLGKSPQIQSWILSVLSNPVAIYRVVATAIDKRCLSISLGIYVSSLSSASASKIGPDVTTNSGLSESNKQSLVLLPNFEF